MDRADNSECSSMFSDVLGKIGFRAIKPKCGTCHRPSMERVSNLCKLCELPVCAWCWDVSRQCLRRRVRGANVAHAACVTKLGVPVADVKDAYDEAMS